MKIRSHTLLAVLAAVALVGSAGLAHAAGKKAAARGKVSKMDSAAKSFTVSNKKQGDTVVVYDDKTAFKKPGAAAAAAPVDGTAADVKDGTRVVVQGNLDAGKVHATQVTIAGARKKGAR